MHCIFYTPPHTYPACLSVFMSLPTPNQPRDIGKRFNYALYGVLDDLIGRPALEKYQTDIPFNWQQGVFISSIQTVRIVLFPFVAPSNSLIQSTRPPTHRQLVIQSIETIKNSFNPVLVTILLVLLREILPTVHAEYLLYTIDCIRQLSVTWIWDNVDNVPLRKRITELDAWYNTEYALETCSTTTA